MDTVIDLLRVPASAREDRPALLGLGRPPLSRSGLLDQIAAVSRSLAAAGVRSGDRVAICIPDGPEMATAFLGVCAVAASAPLNPAYREEEFAFFLSDLQPRALVLPAGSESPARAAAQRVGIPVLDLLPDPERAGIFGFASVEPSGEPLPPAGPDDVALLLHTSGTTARPKLVSLTHRNLSASACHIARTLELTEEDRCLNVMPLFHIHGLLAALLSSLRAGGSVVCTPGFQAPRFFDWIDEFQPTWYTAVPTMHQAILARALRNAPVLERRRLRFLRSSSAALPPQVLAELERVFHAPVIEAYGMTEASHQMASNPLPPAVRKPGTVGLAAGPEIAVLGPKGELLGPGYRGEVAIRGPNVTRGYANNPAANEQAFTNGWFRTGDQGWLDADGYLTLSGRLKEIINRAGEKISPREIDEVLLDHPAVAQAVAFAIPDAQLGEDVGAAVVLHESRSATPAELREHVAARLADFKIPRRIAIVPEIPKGPTGKIQRIGLAEKLGILPAGQTSPSAFVAARTPLEVRLVAIWSEVLRVGRIGVTDDFFTLGGDSVLAAQVAARLRSSLEVEMSPVAVFDTPTIQAMAEQIEAAPRVRASANRAIPRRRSGRAPVLSFAQERLWFLEQFDPGSTTYHRPTNVTIRGPLDRSALERALAAIVGRHEALRTAYPSENGVPVALSAPARMPFAFRDLGDLPASDHDPEVLRLARSEIEVPLDLARGPLIKGLLIRLSDAHHVLLLTVHHIVFDRWSAGVLLRELGALHDAFSRGEPDPLPELPIQFGDFAQWERAQLSGTALEGLVEYWRGKLAKAPALELPTDRPGGTPRRDRLGHHRFRLSRDVESGLAGLSRGANASLFMTLLAGYSALLSARTGQTDVVVASDAANRGRIETEPLIGFFINLLLFRTDLSGNPSFREVLARVRQTALGAYRHQDLPFAKLVQKIRPARVAGATPFARSILVVSAPLQPVRCGETNFVPLDLGDDAARFDLGLFVQPDAHGLAGSWKYDGGLFGTRAIAGLSRDYEDLLHRVVRDPEIRLETLAAALAARG
jgi:acyl-CoA synthetase (AMP-forming)/AMP-acid ligase II